MVKELHLHQIGPVPDLDAEFGPRLNLVTGDNGLGKTFLLDACWYVLTRTWADDNQFYPAPDVPKKDPPSIRYTIVGKTGKTAASEANYRFANQTWKGRQARPPMPGLVIYARIDGGFSLWDPARNYWREGNAGLHRPEAYQFSKREVWEGLEQESQGQRISPCEGFIRDVENWRLKHNGAFTLLQRVLRALSPGSDELLSLGEGIRVRLDDVKDIPTLAMPYGNIPVTQAAAGMRRVLALAYLIVWAWEEHCHASKLQKAATTNRIVLLFDEIEAHLHPKWQRVFLPALLRVVDGLLVKGRIEGITVNPDKTLDQKASSVSKKIPRSIQIIATTHAPLILASAEAVWIEPSDKLFDFNLDANRQVHLEELTFAKQGSVVNWLDSRSFGSTPAYPVEAEQAIAHADAFMLQHPDPATAPSDKKAKIQNALAAVLGGDDEYWANWKSYYQHGKRHE